MKKSTNWHTKSKLVLMLLFVCCCCNGWSQPFNFRFRFIDLPQNYSSQYITLLDKDAAGMLWFVTNNGLHRYDGNSVLTFDLQSKPALPDISINALFADSHNNLWLATVKGLVRFDLQQWTMSFAAPPATYGSGSQDHLITSIAEGINGKMYFGSATGKLFCWQQSRLRFITQLDASGADGTVAYPAIRNIFSDENNVWLSTSAGQLVRFTSAHKTVYTIPEFRQTGVDFFTFNQHGRCLLYAGEAGAFLLDTASRKTVEVQPPTGIGSFKKSKNYPALLNNKEVAFFSLHYETGEKSFSLYNLQTGQFSNLNALYPASLKNSVFRNIKNSNRQVYLSTDRGIAVVDHVKNPFRIALADLQNINSIRTIYKQESGKFFISSYKDGFTLFDEAAGTNKPLSSLIVSGILPWGEDSLLVGTEAGFPMWYAPAQNRFAPIFSKQTLAEHPRLNNYVVCLRRENDTLVWAGSYEGCYLFNPLNGRVLKDKWEGEAAPLQHSHVDDILKVGPLRFFATHEGLLKYNLQTGTTSRLFTHNSSISTARFICLRRVGGEIWAGSYGNGIVVFDTAGMIRRTITTRDGLASNIVFSLPVSGSCVLAGTSKGLSVIDRNAVVAVSYSSQHYFPSNEFNRAAWLVQGDTVFMGTTNGFVRFTIASLLQNMQPLNLPLKLSNVRINKDGETNDHYSFAYVTDPSLTIPAGTKSFSLTFGSLDEAASEMELSYRFASDSTWQAIGSKKEVTFVSLPPGHYILQVRGVLPGGQATQNSFSIPLIVKPLFYQTLWAKLLLVLIGLGMIAWAIKRRERLLRKEQQLRSRIASDLHDEVGSALTRIYFQAEALSGEMVNNSEDTSLKKIAVSSQDALSSMNDMVWSINARYDNASDMIDRMKDYTVRLQEELEWRFPFDVRGSYAKKPLNQISRQNIFLIFKEGLNNAVKHGVENSVRIQVVIEDSVFCLRVENSVHKQTASIKKGQGGHGLQSMKLRAEKIKGKLEAVKCGETFLLTLTAPI